MAAPVYPGTPNELITVMVHFHRAELARMAGWRDRIDRTTNWAITVMAAMLSISLSTPTAHHGVLLFAMLVVWLLLMILVVLSGDVLIGTPDPAQIRSLTHMPQATTLFDRQDRPAFTVFKERRIEVPLQDVSPDLVRAVLAIEVDRIDRS